MRCFYRSVRVGVAVIPAAFLAFVDFHHSLLLFVERLKYSSGYESPGHDESWEVILSAELFKAYNPIDCYAVNKAHDCWQHLHLELRHKEWAFFGIDSHEVGLRVLLGDGSQVHVHDLASLEVLVVEV